MSTTTAMRAGIDQQAQLDHLSKTIERAGTLLPISGPITAFAFLNTLQALEDLPFDEGMRKGARLYGSQPYSSEALFREKLAQGRIRVTDLEAVLKKDLLERGDEPIAGLCSRFELRLSMLHYTLRIGPREELRWFVAETDALTKLRGEVSAEMRDRFLEETRRWVMRDLRGSTDQGESPRDPRVHQSLVDLVKRNGGNQIEDWTEVQWESVSLQALWRICRNGVENLSPPAPLPCFSMRHREVLRAASLVDSDALVNDMLIRFCAAFTDQGLADWSLPNRDQGFMKSFISLYGESAGPPDRWLRGLPQELSWLSTSGLRPLESVLESLELMGVHEDEWDEFIPATLLALRGWAGMLWQMETRPDRVPFPVTKGTLGEYLAVRLILERLALSYVAREAFDYRGPLNGLREAARARIAPPDNSAVEQRAFLVFQLAQVMGWSPPSLYKLSHVEWEALIHEIEIFSEIERRMMFHRAFERRFRSRTLDAVAIHARGPRQKVDAPRFQSVFCIDAREESFRRHIEEVSPDAETFSAAGFFGVAMYYRGVAEAHFRALCPIVVTPKHWVVEDVVYTLEEENLRRSKTRKALGNSMHQVHHASRTGAGGALLTAGLGVLATIPLIARVLFPRLTAQIRKRAGKFVAPPQITRLRLERSTPNSGSGDAEIGFSVEEMANIGERMLREISFGTFSRLIIFMGHGSFCLNNPHKSAYDCGACTGSAGGPNARALAAILNDLRVREILAKRGLKIPQETVFLGGLHNTCDDSITYLDLDLLPKSHQNDFRLAKKTLEEALERNAHERCRRFESAPLNLSFAGAHRHVEGRAEDLAQTRPEFGNASNAVCIVARRERTRGLYLDRRSFLTSYDPTRDDEVHTVLARILSAVVPVCEGINMQYLLSSVDSRGWACGTKLPHNVTSLLGVMDGAASDLRPGLPWQGVEIHEPIRILFIIENTAQAMIDIMNRNPTVSNILRNGWAQLAVLDPDSDKIQIFRGSQFIDYVPETTELPKAATSTDWYRGWRNHLEFAEIGK